MKGQKDNDGRDENDANDKGTILVLSPSSPAEK